MLGRLQMTVKECIDEFVSLATVVFGNSRFFSVRGRLFAPRSSYDHKRFERVIKDMVGRKHKGPMGGKAPSEEPLESSAHMCKT